MRELFFVVSIACVAFSLALIYLCENDARAIVFMLMALWTLKVGEYDNE